MNSGDYDCTDPNLKQAAINHYGCSTLLGIEVDNNPYGISQAIL